jgi:tetratricopeptide (TPR) repeat protein
LIRERQVHAEAIGLTDDSRLPDLRPRSPWEHYDLGRSLLRSGQFAAAAEEFRLTLDQRPQDFWPNFSQGLCAYHLGQFGEALGAFRACVTLAPRLPECYYNRALAYEALGQANEARRDYTRSIELDPQLAGAFLNRGILSYKAGRPLEAIADFRQALGCSPGREMTGRIHYNLALAHSILGDRGSALAEREKAVEAGSREASALDESLRPGR